MCIFCQIVKGKIPSDTVYEDREVLAFLDIMPVNPGHTLVIPKEHYETILDIPAGVVARISEVLPHVARAVMGATGAPGFNILINNYPAAGQVVPHAHFHIVPRFADDGLRLWPGKKYKEGGAGKISAAVRSLLVGKGQDSSQADNH